MCPRSVMLCCETSCQRKTVDTRLCYARPSIYEYWTWRRLTTTKCISALAANTGGQDREENWEKRSLRSRGMTTRRMVGDCFNIFFTLPQRGTTWETRWTQPKSSPPWRHRRNLSLLPSFRPRALHPTRLSRVFRCRRRRWLERCLGALSSPGRKIGAATGARLLRWTQDSEEEEVQQRHHPQPCAIFRVKGESQPAPPPRQQAA